MKLNKKKVSFPIWLGAKKTRTKYSLIHFFKTTIPIIYYRMLYNMKLELPPKLGSTDFVNISRYGSIFELNDIKDKYKIRLIPHKNQHGFYIEEVNKITQEIKSRTSISTKDLSKLLFEEEESY